MTLLSILTILSAFAASCGVDEISTIKIFGKPLIEDYIGFYTLKDDHSGDCKERGYGLIEIKHGTKIQIANYHDVYAKPIEKVDKKSLEVIGKESSSHAFYPISFSNIDGEAIKECQGLPFGLGCTYERSVQKNGHIVNMSNGGIFQNYTRNYYIHLIENSLRLVVERKGGEFDCSYKKLR